MPKLNLKIVNRQLIGDKVFLVTFYSKEDFAYNPGQFLSFKVADKTFRSYSIVEVSEKSSFFDSSKIDPTNVHGRFISFIVNTNQSGPGSVLMESSSINFEVEAVGPAGRFEMQNSSDKKIFVCTGTGLAPFVPMIRMLLKNPNPPKMDLYFGAKNSVDKFFNKLFSSDELQKIKIYTSLSIGEPKEGEYKGFVNQAMLETIQDFSKPEFYLCGNPLMVESVRLMLEEQKAKKVFFEKYSL